MFSSIRAGTAWFAVTIGIWCAFAFGAMGFTPVYELVVAGDRGGSVVSYAREVSRLRDQPVRIRFSGRCESACTLYLSLPRSQTCITRGASFGFHRAHGASVSANSWGSNYMMRNYPSWVREWIRARGGLGRGIMRMNYAYASQFLPPCQDL